jgi:putative endonuclease
MNEAETSPAKPWWRRWFGSRAERAAERFVKRLGYRVLARNFRCPLGELDLVALDEDFVVFIEVWTRTNKSVSPASLLPSYRDTTSWTTSGALTCWR